MPLLDESAWRSGVASPRRPVRRHISRGPSPALANLRLPTSLGYLVAASHAGCLPRSGEFATASFWITPAYTREPPLCRASRCRAPGSFTHAPSAGSTPASRSTDPGAHALCSMRPRDRCVASFWPPMTCLPAELAEHHAAASASEPAGGRGIAPHGYIDTQSDPFLRLLRRLVSRESAARSRSVSRETQPLLACSHPFTISGTHSSTCSQPLLGSPHDDGAHLGAVLARRDFPSRRCPSNDVASPVHAHHSACLPEVCGTTVAQEPSASREP